MLDVLKKRILKKMKSILEDEYEIDDMSQTTDEVFTRLCGLSDSELRAAMDAAERQAKMKAVGEKALTMCKKVVKKTAEMRFVVLGAIAGATVGTIIVKAKEKR